MRSGNETESQGKPIATIIKTWNINYSYNFSVVHTTPRAEMDNNDYYSCNDCDSPPIITVIMLLYYHACMERYYRSVPGKHPLPGKCPCTKFQGVTVAASIQTYGIYIPGKRPCGPKSRVMFKHPWVLTWDATVYWFKRHCKLHGRGSCISTSFSFVTTV